MHCEGLAITSPLNHINLIVFDCLIPEYMTARLQQHQINLVWEGCLAHTEY